MNKKKLFVIMFLLVILCIMTLGYAALQERIDIEGEASVDSVYRVAITSVSEKSKSGNARSTSAPNWSGLSATFYVELTTKTDQIVYDVVITNSGSVAVKLNEAEIGIDGSNIFVAKSGVANGDTIPAGESRTLTLTITYNSVKTSTGTISLNLKYTRVKGGSGEVVPDSSVNPEIIAYTKGEQVELKDNSLWYVVSDSDSDDEYVILLRKLALTGDQVFDSNTEYGYSGSHIEGYLNNEFLPTLTNNSNITWDTNSSVRLIEWNEYTGLKELPNSSSWLYGNSCWWATRMYGLRALVYPDGTINDDYSGYANGVRPVIVTLKSNIK